MTATLLCVDDEPNILNALRRLLRPNGYEVQVAPGGSEGLALLEQKPVDLVISDMRMPGMDGAEFLTQVKARWPDTVRLLLTGYADMDATVAAINQGQIARYLSKPWNDGELLTAVRDALEVKFLQSERRRLEALTATQNRDLLNLTAKLEDRVKERTAQLSGALKAVEASRASMHRSLLNGVRAYANLLELRSSKLAAHGKRVAERARAVALAMKCEPAQVQAIAVAGLLHDIGRLSLSDAALATPAHKLEGEAREDDLHHPGRGADLLTVLESTAAAAEIVRVHHARFDGKGTPKGLRGEEIPLGARILAVVDDFDETVSGLLVHPVPRAEDAMKSIVEGRGRQYDPAAVDAFVALYGSAERPPAKPDRVLRTFELNPGMVLAQDIVAQDRRLLLVAEYALDREMIDGLVAYEQANRAQLSIRVRAPFA